MFFEKSRKRFVACSALPLAIVLGAALLLASRPVFAQASGPLSPATPSDQPVASSPAPASPSSNNRIGDKPNLAGTWKENKSQSDDPRQKMRAAAQQSQSNDPNGTPDASQGPDGGFGGRPGYGGGPYGGPAGQNGGYPGGPGGGLGGPGGQYPQNGPNGGANGGPNGGPYGGSNNGPNNSRGNEDENVGGARGDEQLVIEQTATSARISNGSGRLIAAYAATDQDQPAASSDSDASGDKGGKKNRRNRNAPAVAQWDGDRLIATTQMGGGGSMTRTYELSPDGRQLFVTTKMENRRFNSPVTYRLVYDAVTVSNDGKNR